MTGFAINATAYSSDWFYNHAPIYCIPTEHYVYLHIYVYYDAGDDAGVRPHAFVLSILFFAG